MIVEYRAGRFGQMPLARIAERAAAYINGHDEPMAVCVGPYAVVTVEPVAEAVEDDIVGVFAPSLGMFELFRRIREELKEVPPALRAAA